MKIVLHPPVKKETPKLEQIKKDVPIQQVDTQTQINQTESTEAVEEQITTIKEPTVKKQKSTKKLKQTE